MEKKKAINSKPPVPLFLTKENLSRYAAVFLAYSINQGNMLDVGKHMSGKLFSADYPQYPSSKNLMVNPTLPLEEKFYSIDDNSSLMSSDKGDITSYSSYEDNDNEMDDDSDTNNDSYVSNESRNVKLP